MSSARTLPIAAGHREFTVRVDGQAVPREHQLLSLSVVASVNRIASARLVYLDGAAATGSFALSDSPLFVPGAGVEVLAGGGSDQTLVFAGIVVGQRLKVRETAAAQLIIDCRHAATRLTLARRSASFFDQSDAEVIESLLGAAGTAVDVEASAVRHKQLVQHDCSDWDFSVARAQAVGLLVLTRGAELAVRAPALAGAPVATLAYGATLLEFDAEVDARQQVGAVQTLSWDAAAQALQTQDGEAPAFTASGNLDADALATTVGVESLALHHGALDAEQAAALASAHWLRARVNQVSGRAKCLGLASVQPGDVVELAGVGARFNGRVLVTAVRHEMDQVQGWRTHLQFGGVAPDEALRQRLAAPRTARLLAPVAGLQAGVVTDNEDPDGEFRVRVRLPLVDASGDGVWARVAALDAGAERGFMFRPEIGDEVVLGFFDDDPRQPVLLGMLHSSAHAAPLAPSNDNHEKAFVSRSGMQLHFDDDGKILTLSTPGGNTLALDESAQGIVLEDQNGNRIEMSASGITIESQAALTLKSATDGSLQAGTMLTLEGSASAELKSSGATRLSGSAVQLN